MSSDTTPPMTGGAAVQPDAGTASTEVIRSEERLRTGVERVAAGAVRIAKRVVTEERTVTVTVRREELVVEHVPVAATTQPGPLPERTTAEPALTVTLHEEVPEVTVRVVPRELVRVHVDRVRTEEAVTAEVAREVVEHTVLDEDGRAGTSDR